MRTANLKTAPAVSDWVLPHFGEEPPADIFGNVRISALPDDVPQSKPRHSEQGACLVLLERSAARARELSHRLTRDRGAVLVASDGQQLGEILEFVAPDGIILSALNDADALSMLPAIQAPLGSAGVSAPLICLVHAPTHRQLRPLLHRLGADAVVDSASGADELHAVLGSCRRLMARARVASLGALGESLVSALPGAAILYDSAFRPVHANEAAVRLIHEQSLGRRDARADAPADIFVGAERRTVVDVLDAMMAGEISLTERFRARLGFVGGEASSVDVRIARLGKVLGAGGFLMLLQPAFDAADAAALLDSPSLPLDQEAPHYIRSLVVILDALQRSHEYAQETNGTRVAGGVNEGALLREARSLVSLLEVMTESRTVDDAEMLCLDTLLVRYVELLRPALEPRIQLEYQSPPGAVLVRGSSSRIRAMLLLAIHAIYCGHRTSGTLLMWVGASSESAIIDLRFRRHAAQLALSDDDERAGAVPMMDAPLERALRLIAAGGGRVSTHQEPDGSARIRFQLPLASESRVPTLQFA